MFRIGLFLCEISSPTPVRYTSSTPSIRTCQKPPSQQRKLITTFTISFDVIVNVWFSRSREQKLILGLVELLCDPGRGSFPHTVLRWIKIHLQACAVAESRTRVRLCPNRSAKQRHARLSPITVCKSNHNRRERSEPQGRTTFQINAQMSFTLSKDVRADRNRFTTQSKSEPPPAAFADAGTAGLTGSDKGRS